MRGLDGRPQPPQELVAKLQQYDPRIGLFYTNAAWAITEAWREHDPRRQWIKAGEMQPEMAFDICGYLPVTCSIDQAPAYIERELRNCTAEQFQALRAAVVHWNDAQQDAIVENTVLAAVSDDLDKGNIVSPGISEAVAIDLPKSDPTVIPLDRMGRALLKKAARANKADSA